MKKLLLIIGLMILTVFTFALPVTPEFKVKEDNKNITIEMLNYRVILDKKGHIADYTIIDRKNNKDFKVYAYSGDSFNLIDKATKKEIPAESFVYSKDIFVEKDKKGFNVAKTDKFEITYYYPAGASKKYIFNNSRNYHFDVEINNFNGFSSVPTISTNLRNFKDVNAFVSFEDKNNPQAVLALNSDSRINSDYTFDVKNKSKTVVYIGPVKTLYIKEVFEKSNLDGIMKLLGESGATNLQTYLFGYLVDFFKWLYDITGNFGWAIIIFCLLVQGATFPIYFNQKKMMLKMKDLQPEIEKIKKKYANDQKKQMEEMQKFQKERGYNPAKGCLPILILMIVFPVLWQTIEYFGDSFAYSPSFIIWKDLSLGGFEQNWILLLVMLGAYFINSLLSSMDSKTAWNTILMSLIFPFFFMGLPAGLFIYYAMGALVNVIISLVFNKMFDIKGISVRQLFGLGPKKYVPGKAKA